MAPAKLLVVDDDQAVRELLHRFLTQQNYQVESAEDGKTALALFRDFQPDLVVLDINLPDTTGFHLCQEMQSQTDVFVLMLTSLTDEMTIVKALQDADDYMKKPFSLVELNARIRAILRRPRIDYEPKPEKLKFGDLVIDPIGREATVKSRLVPLTALQFDILYCMAQKSTYAWKREELYQKVWGEEWFADPKVCDVHISQIRNKIKLAGSDFEYIKTVWKVGYKFEVSEKKPQKLKFGDLVINPCTGKVTVKNQIVPLDTVEFKILNCMVQKPNYVWKYSELCKRISCSVCCREPQVCELHINQIRNKIKKCGSDLEYIKTVEEFNYVFQCPPYPPEANFPLAIE